MYQALFLALFSLILLAQACNPKPASEKTSAKKAKTYDAFVGTYTRKEGHVDGKGQGIHLFSLDSTSGYLDPIEAQGGFLVNPSFLWPSHNGRFVYAVEEIGSPDLDTAGRVVALAWNNGQLTKLNQASTGSFAACYVSGDRAGKALFVANYGGSIAAYGLKSNGELGPRTVWMKFPGKGPTPRQAASHPHSTVLSPDEQYLYVPDLGLDQIHCFKVRHEANGPALEALSPCKLPAASGPRHLTFHPNGQFAYVVNELNSTVIALSWDKNSGALKNFQKISTLPADFKAANYCSDLHLSPDGKFLFAANRGHNSLVRYAVAADGQLSLLGHTPTQGDFPRNFALSPDGRFVYAANQNSDNILIFALEADGDLTFRAEVKTPTPVCVKFR
jgi:6-phosphogluconolactonase